VNGAPGSTETLPGGVNAGSFGATTAATTGLVGLLMQSLMAERTVFANGENQHHVELEELTNRLTREILAKIPIGSDAVKAGSSPSPAAIAAAN
jgi:hypothetical protein